MHPYKLEIRQIMGKARGVAGLLLLAVLAFAASARAEAPPFFTTFPEQVTTSVDAGRLWEPRGIATDPVSHRVYVTDRFGGSDGVGQGRVNVFDAWGSFIKGFGWGVADGSDELQVCTTSCRASTPGSQPGQFAIVPFEANYRGPTGIAVDSAGDVYTLDPGNFRVQKFDSDGKFLLMLGGGVNQGPNHPGDVCTAQHLEEGDVCGAGTNGKEPGQIGFDNGERMDGNFLAFNDGHLYVGSKDRIQVFAPDGTYEYSLPLPVTGNPGALAVDPVGGDLYFAFNQPDFKANPTIYRLDSETGAIKDEIVPTAFPPSVGMPLGLAVDSIGHLYVLDAEGNGRPLVLEYDSSGNLLSTFDEVPLDEGGNGGEQPAKEIAIATGLVGAEAGQGDVYVAHAFGSGQEGAGVAKINVFGPAPDPDVVGPPPLAAPSIEAQYVTSVGTGEATLGADVNSHFWTDTTYYVQYGTGKCSEGGCAETLPLPPGQRLTQKVSGNPTVAKALQLTGLEPGTTYHYRFVAQSTGSGGQPVVGAGGEVGKEGAEGTFTTRSPAPAPNGNCSNQSLRVGPAFFLPDCRGYEMVSPVDKNGADVSVLANASGYPAGLDQAASSGDRISYSTYRAFGDAPGSPYTSQYVASRNPLTGWSSRALSPGQKGESVLSGPALDREYKAFDTDLASGWLFRQTDPPLDPAAPAGYANIYRRAADGHFEAAVTVEPPVTPPTLFVPELQGAGGGCTVFRANDKLTPNASASGNYQLYKNCGGQLSLVSITPAGGAAPAASAGTPEDEDENSAHLDNAVSEDGSRIFWSNVQLSRGRLFVRIDDSESIALSKGTAQFLTAAADGSRAIFAAGEELFSFEVGVDAKEKPTLVAKGYLGLLAASEDAKRLYFLSSQVLEGEAQAGKPNLYLYEAGVGSTYIATLAAEDLLAINGRSTPVREAPQYHAAQANPDGSVLVFSSVGSPTGFDNTDARTGRPDTEVFVYRAAADSLLCVSCDPAGTRPTGQLANPSGRREDAQPTAGMIATSETAFYAPRVVTEDGTRVFFTSYVPLAQRDSNGAADVYEWEAEGSGDCTAGSPGHDAAWAGCVNLISSGENPADSLFVDASADGGDVYFSSVSSLVPQDPGLRDIYDAREGGGFPAPEAPPAACEGEACQAPPPAPDDPTPASSAFSGPGNVKDPGQTKGQKEKKKHKKQKKKKHRKKQGKHKRAGADQRKTK